MIIGQDGNAYGPNHTSSQPLSKWARANLQLDPHRTHWLGSLQESDYHHALAISQVHLYLTVPFVLSWSLLEAMASKTPVVASDTPPVVEFLTNNKSALLVDFFDIDQQVSSVSKILDDRPLALSLAEEASKCASGLSVTTGSMRWDELIASC